MDLKKFYALIDYESGMSLSLDRNVDKYYLKIIEKENELPLIFNNTYIIRFNINETIDGTETETSDVIKLSMEYKDKFVYSYTNINSSNFKYKLIYDENAIYLNIIRLNSLQEVSEYRGSLYIEMFEMDYLPIDNKTAKDVISDTIPISGEYADNSINQDEIFMSSLETQISTESEISQSQVDELKIINEITVESNDSENNIDANLIKANTAENKAVKSLRNNAYSIDGIGTIENNVISSFGLDLNLETKSITFDDYDENERSLNTVFGFIPEGTRIELCEDETLNDSQFYFEKKDDRVVIHVLHVEEV